MWCKWDGVNNTCFPAQVRIVDSWIKIDKHLVTELQTDMDIIRYLDKSQRCFLWMLISLKLVHNYLEISYHWQQTVMHRILKLVSSQL